MEPEDILVVVVVLLIVAGIFGMGYAVGFQRNVAIGAQAVTTDTITVQGTTKIRGREIIVVVGGSEITIPLDDVQEMKRVGTDNE